MFEQSVIIIGAQWGDEGKGRMTDLLAEHADVIIRFAGGPNAGHTVIANGEEYHLHLIPSGILYTEKMNIVGNGVVVNPESFVGEMEKLEERGISCANLFVSDAAHVIMPYHLLLDQKHEELRGKHSIGTTKKGIGPAYTDKVSRRGVRIGDLLERDSFLQKVQQNLDFTNMILEKVFGEKPFVAEELWERYQPFAEKLRPMICNTSLLLDRALKQGKRVLFEGAQGTLLDIDHGTYPFVTSSNPSAGGACSGSGLGPSAIKQIIGVTKAYLTRVGEGPFPTEIHSDVGRYLQEKGGEIGVTTQRIRRCGWLDLPLLRHAIRVNGFTHLAMTKLDVLSGLETIQLCTHYKTDDDRTIDDIENFSQLDSYQPVYEEMPGWDEEITQVRTLTELPQAAQDYVRRIAELCDVEISMISVGPRREQIIHQS